MTIEAKAVSTGVLVRASALALCVWFTTLAGLAAAGVSDRVLAIAPGERAGLEALAASQALILAATRIGPIVAGGRTNVRALYAGGAWLVLPALAGGCRGARGSWQAGRFAPNSS